MPRRYATPVPGGRIGRTDQGVDISAPPGTPVYAIEDEQLVGIVPNWYKGQPFYVFKSLIGNTYNYVAEQFTSKLKHGQIVAQGQQIGEVAPSGTGLELGFAQSRTAALSGHPTPGYREGQATALGGRYRRQVIGSAGGGGTMNAGPATWLKQGGWSLSEIPTMVAIGGAESHWRVDAVGGPNADGTYDYGWLQINSSHGYDKQRLLSDPVYTARAARAIWKSQGFGAWSTFKNGAYRAYMGQQGPSAAPGRVRPGGQDPNASNTDTVMVSLWDQLWNPGGRFGKGGGIDPLKLGGQSAQAINGVGDFLKWIAWLFHPLNILRAVEVVLGFPLMILGVAILIKVWTGASAEAAMSKVIGLTPQGRAVKVASHRRRSPSPPVNTE